MRRSEDDEQRHPALAVGLAHVDDECVGDFVQYEHAGAFTPEQLRAFKTTAARDRPIGLFNWKREQLILRAGGGLYDGCGVFLEMAGHQMIWLTADGDGDQMLNMDARTASSHSRCETTPGRC